MPSNNRDLVHLFASHTAGLTYDQLPDEAQLAAKKSILDTLGVILAASGMEPAVRAVIDIVKESGGTPDCTVLARIMHDGARSVDFVFVRQGLKG
jgi:2-methylcitrate dehydratase PrpD